MKFAFKHIVATAAFVAAGAANAASVTIDNVSSAADLYTVGGAGALTFSTNLRNALNIGSVAASAFGGAESQIVGPAGAYTNITVSASANTNERAADAHCGWVSGNKPFAIDIGK